MLVNIFNFCVKRAIVNNFDTLPYVFVSAKQIYMLSQTCRDRMLAHSHSATSLYNLSQFKPISDQFTSIVYVVPASNLRTGVVWPRVVFCHFHILASKIS